LASGAAPGFFERVGQKQKKSKYTYVLVGFNFLWVGRSTEWIGRGLPGLSLKPPLHGLDRVWPWLWPWFNSFGLQCSGLVDTTINVKRRLPAVVVDVS